MTELFYHLAGAAQVKVGDPSNLELIPKIVEWLEGHPLAMTLVVPLMGKRGIRRVWDGLQEKPLKGIAAAFELSFERLNKAQRQLFTRLSVFTIPVQYEAAEALLTDSDEDIEDLLDVLVQRALVQFDGDRYSYHALVRQYAYGNLQEPVTVHELAAIYLQSKITGDEKTTPAEQIEEVDQWHLAQNWSQMAQRASGLVGNLERVGYWAEIQRRLEFSLEATQTYLKDSDLEATLLDCIGQIKFIRGEWDDALESYGKVIALAAKIENRNILNTTYHNMGMVYQNKGSWNKAIDYYKRSMEIKSETALESAATFNNLGTLYEEKGDIRQALKHYQKALEIADQANDLHIKARIYSNLGNIYHQKEEWDKALDSFKYASAIFTDVSDLVSLAQMWSNTGNLYESQGKWEQALEYHIQALQAFEQLDDKHGLAQASNNLGLVYRRLGKLDKSLELFEQSVKIFEQIGDILHLGQAWGNLGHLCHDQGDDEQAKAYTMKAFLVFLNLDIPSLINQAASFLVQLTGSQQAAQSYYLQYLTEQGDQFKPISNLTANLEGKPREKHHFLGLVKKLFRR